MVMLHCLPFLKAFHQNILDIYIITGKHSIHDLPKFIDNPAEMQKAWD